MYQNIYVDREDHLIYIWDDSTGMATLPSKSFSYCWVPDKNGTHLTMFGKRVSKKYNPYMVVGEKYESDIPQETRVLTDLYLNDDEPSVGHTTMFFDIETDSSGGFPDIAKADKVITDISAYDSTSKQYVVFTLDETGTFDASKIEDAEVIVCETEYQLLMMFLEYYGQVKPTIISGWNSDFFDVPYLFTRIKNVCGYDDAVRLSPIGKVKYSNFRNTYSIAGVSSIDYLPLYKKFTYIERPNYRLGTIAQIELNESKVLYEGSLDDFRKADPVGFVKYNLQDVRLLVKFEEKLKFIELVRGVCHVGHVPYEDYGMSSRWLEGAILVYLHRQKIVAIDKPSGGKEKYAQQKEDDEEGFTGAFVKVVMPGFYEWVYSLDLASLYPSIIMSLNISPESKMGRVVGWNPNTYNTSPDEMYKVILQRGNEKETVLDLKLNHFRKFLEESNYAISANGILYVSSSEKEGVIPAILSKWFAERTEYKKLQEEASLAGDAEKAEFYDRRQHIQKIILNSLYGTLGLAVFRFYDVDNALAVTSSGQEVIKHSSQFVNNMYVERGATPRPKDWLDLYWEKLKTANNKKAKAKRGPEPDYPDENDFCLYVDTDSLYFSPEPLWHRLGGDSLTAEDKLNLTVKIAFGVEAAINKHYDKIANELFNCKTHRLFIRGEAVSSKALFITKKKYAMEKVYDLEKKAPTYKRVVKGLDIIRSTFPPAFRKLMTEVLDDILTMKGKDSANEKLTIFYDGLSNLGIKDIARNIAVKVLSKYEEKAGPGLADEYLSGSPAHVKAAITYNRMLRHLGKDTEYVPMKDGDKIIYVMLRENEYGIPTIALTGERDCPEILEFAKAHLDREALFVKELKNKLDDFYEAMHWGEIPIGPPPKIKKTRGKKNVNSEENL